MSINNITLHAIREIAEKNCIYYEESQTLVIKQGRCKGTYLNINYESAKILVECN